MKIVAATRFIIIPQSRMRRFVGTGLRLSVAVSITSWLSACGASMDDTNSAFNIDSGDESITVNSVTSKTLIASGVVFQSHLDNKVRHRVSAETISVAPRGFGPFSVNGINEILVEDSRISVFPQTASNKASSNGDSYDFTDHLQEYAKSLEDTYGLITRIHMKNIHITLHEAGRSNRDVYISAKDLFREFGKDDSPELYELEVFDNQSTETLRLTHAIWDTKTSKLILSDSSKPAY